MTNNKKKKLPPGVRERDGRFTYRYSVEVIKDGKRTRKQKETKSFGTAKEAYEAGIQIEADKLRGRLVDEKVISVDGWQARWVKDYEIERAPRSTTLRNRRVALDSFKSFIGAKTRMKDITPDDYQQYLNHLKVEGKTPGTIKQYHTTCKMFFADAFRKGVIASNPTAGSKIPAFKITLEDLKNVKKVPKFLEKEQLKHFLNTVRFRGRKQEYEIFLTLAYSGLRIGELLALQVSDFNEKERTISVTKTITQIGGIENYELGPPKNMSSIREVSIGDTVIKAIKNQLAWRRQKIENGEVMHDADFIFWGIEHPGYPASKTYLATRFGELLKLASLPPGLTPHSLRHTHVSLLAEDKEDLAVIQERLGHKNDEVTRLVYLHVTEQRRKAVPDRFEKLMNS
ncbi:tyrosine-type recombinase/integrase [Cohnella sp. GbtcB17]|uniref:tyrosine-type recombinase/integrase n=1 Tax=Cohnella sp. GbtcB17 TaxID=2824762 RepID=UPI001C309586|nr:tyrosine-type recombinase/integrase [Cohnella sp. GbtcB17]